LPGLISESRYWSLLPFPSSSVAKWWFELLWPILRCCKYLCLYRSNNMIIDKWWVWKVFVRKWSWPNLVAVVIFLESLRETMQTSIRTAGVAPEIRTEYLSNTSEEECHLSSLPGHNIVDCKEAEMHLYFLKSWICSAGLCPMV
jgi:hypothetical protein